jgi:8-oxo-dGTP pyrophosphatase MutT (NUDIX family)
MIFDYEHSAGVIPFRPKPGSGLLYLVIHSARVRNPRARWEFPKGRIEPGETAVQASMRELREETGINSYSVREGFERDISYTFIRDGRQHHKTVSYFIAEVFDYSTLIRSDEHVTDSSGCWYRWGSFEQVSRLLCHARTRRLLSEANAWLERGATDHAELHRF